MRISRIYFSCLSVCIAYGVTFSLFAGLVEATNTSGLWLGFNASLPALGWILGSVLVPYLQLRMQVPIKLITVACLVIAMVGAAIPLFSQSFWALCVTRLIFGGALGMFLRCMEYVLVSSSDYNSRGRYLAAYGITFLVGIILGSSLQPSLPPSLTQQAALIVLLLIVGLAVLLRVDIAKSVWPASRLSRSALSIVPILPAAFFGVAAYALYESVPAYLLQGYAVRQGASDEIAAYTLAAAALGNLIFVFPILSLSGKLGREKVLVGCAIVACTVPLLLPQTVDAHVVFLGLIAVLGASAGVSYGLSLAMLGDRFDAETLVLANAAFGAIYAVSSVLGPLLHGAAMEMMGPDGLMYSVSAVFGLLAIGIVLVATRQHYGISND